MNKIKSYSGKKIKIAVASLFLLTAILIASSALSDDYKYSFMFTVPVNVQKLSVYATEIRVFCNVKDQNGNFLTKNFTGVNYGNNIVAIDSKGGFSGTLTDAVKLMNPSEASKAKTYVCSVQPGNGSSYTNFKDCDSDIGYFCLKPGTDRTLDVQGTIP